MNKNRWNSVLDKSLYEKAGYFLSEAEKMMNEIGSDDLKQKDMYCRIRYYRQGGRLDEAIDYCEEKIQEFEGTISLTVFQLYDQLTALYHSAGDYQSALQSHQKLIVLTYQYLAQREASRQQELEAVYETNKKQREIDQKTNEIRLSILGIAFVALLLELAIRRTRRLHRHNAELQKANQGKEKLLSFISKDLSSPTLQQKNAVIDLAENLSNLSTDEIKERCADLVQGADALNVEVVDYVLDLVEKRKEVATTVGLTAREMDILRESYKGKSAKEIADILHLSPRTVSNHKQSIYSKLEVRSNAEMLAKAKNLGLV